MRATAIMRAGAAMAAVLWGAPACAGPSAGAASATAGATAEGAGDAGPDERCLAALQTDGVAFTRHSGVRGVRTPVEPTGRVRGIELVARGRRKAVMDCQLLRALAEAAPIFHDLQISELHFSGAYEYRRRRHSHKLSQHARGLAIDVHVVHVVGDAAGVDLDLRRDFEVGVGAWVNSRPLEREVAECVGAPTTDASRRLRTLACRLRASSIFRMVISPDDNADHRDHLHVEAYADARGRVQGILGKAGIPGETAARRRGSPRRE